METITIEVPKDAFEWLQGLMKEINEQDNRATATPYYYYLKYSKKDDDGNLLGEARVEVRNNIFFTEKAARGFIKANAHALPEGTYDYLDWGGRNPELCNLLTHLGAITGVPYERK